MYRRQFVRLSGALPLAAVFPWACAKTSRLSNSRTLVDSPEHRKAYLEKMLKTLCADIGPRPAGSDAYNRAAEFVRAELALGLPKAELDWFAFKGWRPLGETHFSIGGEALECFAHFGAAPTPPEGVAGILIPSGIESHPFAIAKPGSKEALAYIGIAPFGRAIVRSPFGSNEALRAKPMATVGKENRGKLEQAAAKKTPVLLRYAAEDIPEARSCNAVGTLPGSSTDEIIVMGHLDTQYNTPGAHDNAASLVVAVMLAHAFSGETPAMTLTFIGTAAEEYDYLGMKHYVAKRKADGSLGRVKYVLNFDSLTYGLNHYLYSKSAALTGLYRTVHADLKLATAPEYFDQDPGNDAKFFAQEGIPSVEFNSRGDNERTLPLWHHPDDKAETINAEFVESSFVILKELLARLSGKAAG